MVAFSTIMMGASLLSKGFNFIGQRQQDTQTLQQLNQDRLLAEWKGLTIGNEINDIADQTLANNDSINSSSGYAYMDSNSYKAIQKSVNSKRKKDLLNTKISTDIAILSINNSLKNLNQSMIFSEMGLVMDVGTIGLQHSNFMKNKSIEKAYRNKEVVYRNNVIKLQKEQLQLAKDQASKFSYFRKQNTFNNIRLLKRVKGTMYSNSAPYSSWRGN